MNAVVLVAAIVLATGAWIALFRGDRRDIWPRTWVIAGVLIGFSIASLALVGRLNVVVGPVDGATMGVGLLVGAAWLVATHIGHAVLCRLFPSFIEQVRDLYGLGVGDPPARVLGPILAMALAEELLFRGVVQGSAGFVAGVLVYTAVQVAERKWALVLAAFLGGVVWGGLFEVTGGLVAPFLAHALWTVSLTLVWPLGGCGNDRIAAPADVGSP
ncbi:CPBP family glutamic-type intramembrane protease [Actinospongicola halichondriae]|uniref:CPBP family glutamic-type intramembrane protease n=1 Tax=Actinospongicola halichondriae TaxID=3236844 RepID=UPI003D52D68F